MRGRWSGPPLAARAQLFPAIANGTLVAHSLDTGAFRDLEALTRRLSAGGGGSACADAADVARVWAALRATYPASAFG